MDTTQTQQVAPTQATDTQKQAWEWMDYAWQKAFVDKNTGFDPTKYNLSYKSATWTPETINNNITNEKVSKWELPTSQAETQTHWAASTAVDPNQLDTPERLNEVKTNLEWYTSTNKELFKNRWVYDDYFKYDTRSDLQKKIIDDFWTNKGKQVMYGNMTANQLADGVSNGDFSEADLDYLKVNDPNKYQQYEGAKVLANQKIQNNLLVSSMNSLLWDKDNNWVMDYVDQLNKKADESFQSYKQYQEAQTTPEMQDLQTTMWTLNQEIKTAQLDQIALKDKIISQYHWVPTSIINAMVADQTADIQDTIARKTITYNAMLWTYNSKLESVKNNYELETQRLKVETDKFNNQLTSLQSLVWISTSLAALTTPAVDENIGKTINVWTTKNPQYMQWNPDTQTYDIPVASAAGTGGWGGWGGVWAWTSKTDLASQASGESLDLLASTTRWERITAMTWAIWWIISPRVASIQANYEYIKNNLMLGDFVELKKQWATFGAMSNEEWTAIKSAATKLQYSMSDADRNHEIGIIRQKMWAAAARAWVAGGTIEQMAGWGTTATAGWTPAPIAIKLPLNASFSKIIAPRLTQ